MQRSMNFWKCVHLLNLFMVNVYRITTCVKFSVCCVNTFHGCLNVTDIRFFKNVFNHEILMILLQTLLLSNIFTGRKCVEYNFIGSIIQESIISCSNASVPCPEAYKSTEAFKCKKILATLSFFAI